jgi:hypothetical protein
VSIVIINLINSKTKSTPSASDQDGTNRATEGLIQHRGDKLTVLQKKTLNIRNGIKSLKGKASKSLVNSSKESFHHLC